MKYDKLPLDNHLPNYKTLALKSLEEIIKRLPPFIRELIEQSFKHKRIPKEYMMASIFFAFSNAAGLAFKTNHNGYENYSNLYFALIGSRGDAKSPAMHLATSALTEFDNEEYINNQNVNRDSELANRKQFLIQNATIEAAMYAHYKNPYSIGLYIDELFVLLEKMANGNNNEGAQWRTFLLQGSTNHYIDVIRKTTESYRIPKSYPTLLGSIQHQFISKMFANGNLESGFIDRILFTTPLTRNSILSGGQIAHHIIVNYNNNLNSLLNYRKHMESENKEYTIPIGKDAEEMLNDYLQKLILVKETLPSMEEEYNAKMQISIYKFIILVHLITNSRNNNFQSEISLEEVDLAILINEFYFLNFKIVLENKNEVIDSKILLSEIIKLAKANNIPQKDIVALTSRSKGYISKLYNL